MQASDIRQTFLDYFQAHGHKLVASSSLVPSGDPTLLFTNAGMVQFKDVFLGMEARPYRRAVSAQKCVRAGGKHNDLDQVGRTARHQTFFEMLGNFSFGDYFKREAMELAWGFLIEELHLDPRRLWVTVYESDDEAYQLWQDVAGIPPERIVRLGDKDNFWSMGDTGPCGPSSEIFVDRGEQYRCGPQCGLGLCECDRIQEIWNLVFMQYDRDHDGVLSPLPRPSIDTGLGLERVAAYMQGVESTFDTDVMRPLIAAVETMSGRHYDQGPEGMAFRVIADHVRALTFLRSDGVTFSNLGRGYVMRRILRRASRYGRLLGLERPFLFNLVPAVIETMGSAYPELRQQQDAIQRSIEREEERFLTTLSAGLNVLHQKLAALSAGDIMSGHDAFLLYDTYGFPLDLTQDAARERGVFIDQDAFEREMTAQRERAKKSRQYLNQAVPALSASQFVGYETLELADIPIASLVIEGEEVSVIGAGESGYVALPTTPYYAESGGQVGDQGTLSGSRGRALVVDVVRMNGSTWHYVEVVEGELAVGDLVAAAVSPEWRQGSRRNHTGTHLLHAALRDILGSDTHQTGSLVAPDRLRFDFAYDHALSPEVLTQVEDRVNQWILEDRPVVTEETGKEDALVSGAVAFFGDKYGDRVRVVSVPGASRELCGGTHAARTGELGQFLILQESSVGSGSRRIEAVTGPESLAWSRTWRERQMTLTRLLKTSEEQVVARTEELLNELKQSTLRLAAANAAQAVQHGRDLAAQAEAWGSWRVVIQRVAAGLSVDGLRQWMDGLKSEVDVAVLASGHGQQAAVVVFLGQPLIQQGMDAAGLAKRWAPIIGGGGGGRAEIGQAGGRFGERIDALLEVARVDLADALQVPATATRGGEKS